MRRIGRCRLPELLAMRGWTQNDLAEYTRLSKSQISDYVTHQRIMSLPIAGLIAGVLQVHIEDLYEGLTDVRTLMSE